MTLFVPIHGHRGSKGKTKSPTYHSWASMRQRCGNPNHRSYGNYGGLGVTVCERWNDFANFLEDMGERPEGMTIDRIDVEGHYEPGNCKWSTKSEQELNKRRKGSPGQLMEFPDGTVI